MSARCDACGQQVTWAQTADGKLLPCEFSAEGAFTLEQARYGEMPVLRRAQASASGCRYVSHYARCSRADQLRSKPMGAA